MNVESGTRNSFCWEYLFRIFSIVSLQCGPLKGTRHGRQALFFWKWLHPIPPSGLLLAGKPPSCQREKYVREREGSEVAITAVLADEDEGSGANSIERKKSGRLYNVLFQPKITFIHSQVIG
jgi:hypothetical protein